MLLWDAADQIGARATFAATLDEAGNCGPEWRERAAPNGRPHFSLTAEHLFDLQLRGPAINTDLFEWREIYPTPLGTQQPPDRAKIDKAFSDYVEGTATDYSQLWRAPWLSPDFIDPMHMPDMPDAVDPPDGGGAPDDSPPTTAETSPT